MALTSAETASLIIAVLGLCASIAQAVGGAGSARKVGTILAGIVGGAAVLVFVLLVFVFPSSDTDSDSRAFQARIREICDDNRSLEVQTNRDFAQLQREHGADRLAYMAGWIDTTARFAYASRQLSDELEAVEPPSSQADRHHTAVLTWQRLVRLMDGTVEAARLADTPEEAAAAADAASRGAQGDQLNTTRDALLRKLADSGCDPSVPNAVLSR